MGWFSNAWKKVKKVFKKVTKVVKKVVKGIGKAAKKVWNGVKGAAKKAGAFITKLGPVANIAMNFIPGFGQLWAAYGVWGAMAKGAITGFVASGGSLKGALLGAGSGALGYGYNKLPGNTITEKFTNAFKLGEGSDTLSKSFSDAYKKLGSDYTGRIGADTTNLPPSQRGLYANSAPSVESIQGAYQANLDNGMSHESIMKSFNEQGARDAAWWKANPEPAKEKTNAQKIAEGLSKWSARPASEGGYTAPAGIYDTSPLNQYNTEALAAQGTTGMGTDVYDVEKLGLLSAVNRMRRADKQFLS